MVSWYVLILVGTIFLAASDILRKQLLISTHTLEQLATEFPFRAIILLFFIPFLEPMNTLQWLSVIGTAVVASLVYYYRGHVIKHLPISISAPMHNFSPVILLILGVVFLKEIPTIAQLAGMLFIIAGGYLLSAKQGSNLAPFRSAHRSKHTKSVLVLLVLLSIIATLNRIGVDKLSIHVPTYLFWTMLFSYGIIFLFHHKHYGSSAIPEKIRAHYVIYFFAALLSIIDILFFYQAIAHPLALIAVAVTIRRSATLLETLLGGALFHEQNLWQKAAACVIMLLGISFVV